MQQVQQLLKLLWLILVLIAFIIDNNVSLSANEKEQVLTEPLIMKESEVLKVQASSGATDVIASILEINREDR